ncbi:MAG: hypothetical protein LBP62_03200 [Clostridiales bacterium]|jgi:hypothetical protein|nr:hypothetical protein [Clostridiales bacterium]
MIKFLKNTLLLGLISTILLAAAVGLFGTTAIDYIFKGLDYVKQFFDLVLEWLDGFDGVYDVIVDFVKDIIKK